MTKVLVAEGRMDVTCVGVDGCPGGWVAAIGTPGDAPGPQIVVAPAFRDILALLPPGAVVAVDMPTGLPDSVGPGGRGPEAALRPHLGARQSSVFSVPPRAAVYAADYAAACAASLAASDPPRKVSKQCFNLFPKIRELDALLRADPELAERVFESHPEGVFMVLNGRSPLAQPKKVKSRPHGPGLEERRGLLAAASLDPALLAQRPPAGCGADDLLDACACLVAARRIARGEAIAFPPEPARDAFGLRIAIWA